MRILQSSIFRAICAVAFGYLLVIYRHELLRWTTITFGILFIVSGLVSIISYYAEKRHMAYMSERISAMSELRGEEMGAPSESDIKQMLKPNFPFVGLGSIILGAILAFMPTNFAEGMMFVIAGLLILGAANLIFNLALARRFAAIGIGFWVVPVLLLALGILIVAKPTLFASMPFHVLGWGLIVYGVIEFINGLKIHQCQKQYERIEAAQQAAAMAEAEEAVVIDNTEDTAASDANAPATNGIDIKL